MSNEIGSPEEGDEKLKIWLASSKMFYEERYVTELSRIQSEIHQNPDYKKWREESGNHVYMLIPEYQAQFDSLNEDINNFKKSKYPELLFDSDNVVKQNQIALLKKDSNYQNLINGIDFFSNDFEEQEEPIQQIENLINQVLILMDTKYSGLFENS